MQPLTAGITKATTGIDGIVWNILGQTYVPKVLSEQSFAWHATFPPGTFVIEQGEAPRTLFLILSGEAEAVRETGEGEIEILGRLEPGHFFGETGIATGNPRNAHVIARTPLTCLLFSPAEPTRFVVRGAGAHQAEQPHALEVNDERLGEATARIDCGDVIDRKVAAIAAYRSQFVFDPDTIPRLLLSDLFGTEYFVRARPVVRLESEIV